MQTTTTPYVKLAPVVRPGCSTEGMRRIECQTAADCWPTHTRCPRGAVSGEVQVQVRHSRMG